MATELIVTAPFPYGGISYSVGTLIADPGIVAGVLASANLKRDVAQIQVSGNPGGGGGTSTSAPTTGGGTGGTTVTGSTGGTTTPAGKYVSGASELGSAIILSYSDASTQTLPNTVTTQASLAAIQQAAATATAQGNDAAAILVMQQQHAADVAGIASLQQQFNANTATDAAQGARLDADDTKIATLSAQIAALMSGSGSGVAAPAYVAFIL